MMKKRILSLLLAMLMVMTLVPMSALAETAVTSGNCGFNDGDNVKWSLDSSGVLTISGSGKMADYAEEPEECMYRFWNAPWEELDVKSVVIKDGVTNIGAGAFAFTEIEDISIPSTVTDIGVVAFSNCENLQTITIPSSVKNIDNAAFRQSGIKSAALPNGLKQIEYCAFVGCSNLESVTIPGTVTSIGWRAFDICDNLKNVYFGGSQAQWRSVNVEKYNDVLSTVTMHYDYKYPDASTTSTGFADVASDAYYTEPVQWAVENKITNGTDATHFSPDQGCTRGQVVTFLWRAAGSPTVSGDAGFVDVKSTDYFYDAVKWAVANNITNGTDATHFSPSATCTRGQVVTFMYRAKGSPATSGSCGFVDVKSSDYYYNAVIWAVANEITNGTDATHFSPSATCTRAQVVTFLYRNAQK